MNTHILHAAVRAVIPKILLERMNEMSLRWERAQMAISGEAERGAVWEDAGGKCGSPV